MIDVSEKKRVISLPLLLLAVIVLALGYVGSEKHPDWRPRNRTWFYLPGAVLLASSGIFPGSKYRRTK